MELKAGNTYTYNDNVLTLYKAGKPVVRQPFDSDTGKPFDDINKAFEWAYKYFPDLFA